MQHGIQVIITEAKGRQEPTQEGEHLQSRKQEVREKREGEPKSKQRPARFEAKEQRRANKNKVRTFILYFECLSLQLISELS